MRCNNRREEREASARRAARVYSMLLRMYPRVHRRAFGEQMLQTFRDHYRDRAQADGGTGLRFWLGVVGDEAKSLPREQWAAMTGRILSMRKIVPGILAAALLVAALALVIIPGRTSGQQSGMPLEDPLGRPILQLATLGLTLSLYAALVTIIVIFARSTLRSASPVIGCDSASSLAVLSGYLS